MRIGIRILKGKSILLKQEKLMVAVNYMEILRKHNIKDPLLERLAKEAKEAADQVEAHTKIVDEMHKRVLESQDQWDEIQGRNQ